MTSVLAFAGAASAKIAGCFAMWAWARNGASARWLLPGMASLGLFAWLLTLVEADAAGQVEGPLALAGYQQYPPLLRRGAAYHFGQRSHIPGYENGRGVEDSW